jgi:serine-type D-Ala-D-Ala carboxypeptidase/endopeptidase
MHDQRVLAHLDDLAAQYIHTRPQVGLVFGFLDGEQRFMKGYGRMHNDATTLPDAQRIYEIGSITKVPTGITLARLEREGRLGLEDTVAHYLPSTLNLPPPADTITLQHLATHTSGLPRLPDNLDATIRIYAHGAAHTQLRLTAPCDTGHRRCWTRSDG